MRPLSDRGGVAERWVEALETAYGLARGERLAEIRGDRRVKRFDSRGLHPYSEAWGRILSLEGLDPELAALRDLGGDVACEPGTLRHAAHRDAEEAVARLIRSEGRVDWAAERRA